MTLYLGEQVTVVMDRPLGSKHPKHGFIYPINYGYIPNTVAGDGEEVDVYVIGEFEPLERFEGYIVAIIIRSDDVEEKMVVCKQRDRYTLEQIKVLVEFQERFFDSKIIMA
ncbi:MAG: inorganic diphosphatase [Cellulosilyticaceae bacterium]